MSHDTSSKSNFYPRSPRGERQELPVLSSEWIQISIHAPREGSDTVKPGKDKRVFTFLSTLPARGATISPRFASMGW